MRKLWTLVGSCFLFLVALSARAGTPLGFAEAWSKAQAQSLDDKRAALQVEQARLAREMVDLSADPRLNLQGQWGSRYTDSDDERTGSVSRIHSYSANLSATLYDFGRTSAKEQQADLSVEAKERAKQATESDVFWTTARAYQAVASAVRLSKLTAEQVGLAEARLHEQQRNYRQGLRPESDVVTAEVDLGRARINAQAAADDHRLASLRLAQLIYGGQVPASLDLPYAVATDSVAAEGPTAWTGWLKALPPAQVSAAEKRLESEGKALDAEKAGIDAQYWPTLSGGLVAQTSTSAQARAWSPLTPSYSGQVTLAWDVPWNGMNRNETLRVSLEKRDNELATSAVRRQREQQEAIAAQQLEDASRSWTQLSRQLELVERQQALVRKRYLSGQATALELSTSESTLITARLDRVRLSNTVASALLSLAEARGAADPKVIAQI